MKVVLINKSDLRGGAAVVTFRLMHSLRALGIDARMLVTEKLSDSPFVELAASPRAIKSRFLLERLRIFIANRGNRATLFKLDAGAFGLPLASHPLVRQADVVCLNWINQGVLSLTGIKSIAKLGKPIVWTLHDLWPMTGICHLPGKCSNYTAHCSQCPLLNYSSLHPLSVATWHRKQRLYQNVRIHFVAVSNWVKNQCHDSALLRNASINVIPNAFPINQELEVDHNTSSKIRIVMGAARLDDSIKGFPTLIAACHHLAQSNPQLAKRLQLITYGDIKDKTLFDKLEIEHIHLGMIQGEDRLNQIYDNAEIVISSSHYETFGATLVEGQAHGCIPIAFNHGGQSDIIRHQDTGYLAEYDTDIEEAAKRLADGVVWACENISDEMRLKLHNAAYNNFSAPAVAKKYIQLFQSLVR